MSDEILGYDVNGEALRAGDRVATLYDSAHGHPAGTQFDVTSIPVHPENRDGNTKVVVDNGEYNGMACPSWALRRLQSGRDVFEQARDRALSEGNPDAQHEWTEPTTSQWAQAVLSGMPWTEPRK